MTYYESAEGEQITKQRALTELATHCCDDPATVAEFEEVWTENQENDLIEATVVLEFLGH